MSILHCYVDDETLATLELVSAETGRRIEELAEAAISEAAVQAKVAAMPRGRSTIEWAKDMGGADRS